jgi:pyruvate/2-oxoglutarate dehydrogenase complex dihydrolipoamide dehydrogenase (E3) component
MVPQVTFTDPEVPRVGLTDAEAAEKTDGARIAFLPMNAIDYRSTPSTEPWPPSARRAS